MFKITCMKCGKEIEVYGNSKNSSCVGDEDVIEVTAYSTGYGGECGLSFECVCGNENLFEDE